MRRAAEAINMTQPAISQQVSELEKLIGAELFFRHAKGVEPTEVANELIPVAHRVLAALQDGSEAVTQLLRSNSSVVRVAASPAAIGGLLLNTLGPFSVAYPNIQVHISEMGGNAPSEGQYTEYSDLICTRSPQIVPEGWAFTPCLDDSLVVVCGAKHALANRPSVDADELGQHRWLINRVDSVARRRFEAAFEDHGWDDSTRGSLVCHVPELTKEILVTQDYLAILPQSVAQPWIREGIVKNLDTTLTENLAPLGVLHPSTAMSQASNRFVTFLRSAHDPSKP